MGAVEDSHGILSVFESADAFSTHVCTQDDVFRQHPLVFVSAVSQVPGMEWYIERREETDALMPEQHEEDLPEGMNPMSDEALALTTEACTRILWQRLQVVNLVQAYSGDAAEWIKLESIMVCHPIVIPPVDSCLR